MSEELQSAAVDAPTAAEERRSIADGRCGHTHEASAVTGLGGVCCWRPVWGETGRCIWHADVAQKPSRELEGSAPSVGDRLDGAIFRDVELSGADWPAGLTITDARYVNCNLEATDLSGADLRYSHFEGVDAQGVNLRGANLEHAEFDRTDLREADIRGARLHYAVFDNARIDEGTSFGSNVVYEEELLDTDDERRLSSLDAVGPKDHDNHRLDRYEAAHWTYDELQRLAEDNGLTEASRNYYRKQKNLRRREAWEFGPYSRALAQEAWRWTTGYGASPWRVIATSATLILLCGLLYPLTSGIIEPTAETTVTYRLKPSNGIYLNFIYLLKSIYFSIVTFTTLGYGDLVPLQGWARAIAAAEALLGQLLMALLVFVLTRNVTWSE